MSLLSLPWTFSYLMFFPFYVTFLPGNKASALTYIKCDYCRLISLQMFVTLTTHTFSTITYVHKRQLFDYCRLISLQMQEFVTLTMINNPHI